MTNGILVYGHLEDGRTTTRNQLYLCYVLVYMDFQHQEEKSHVISQHIKLQVYGGIGSLSVCHTNLYFWISKSDSLNIS